MANTTFIDLNTIIVADWLNDVNNCVYNILGNGTTVPASVSALKTNLSLQNVDNTSDANKPLSTAATNALAVKVDKTSSTGSAVLPTGTTAQRDGTPSLGYIRYNTTLSAFEGYTGSGWGSLGGGGSFAQSGNNTDITSLGNNTSTVYTTGGTSTAYTITPNPVITAYTAGQSFFVNFNAASGASPTLQINGVASPPNLVEENIDGTFSNIAANRIPTNHRSRVTLISATQALVEKLPTLIQFNTAVTVSGSPTSVNWTPPSWAKRIDVDVVRLSGSGSSPLTLRLGTGGTAKTSGYAGSNSLVTLGTNPTTNVLSVGFSLISATGGTDIFSGKFSLTLVDSATNAWTCVANLGMTNTGRTQQISGDVSLSGVLDLIRVTTEGGTDTIDNGVLLNITYWG